MNNFIIYFTLIFYFALSFAIVKGQLRTNFFIKRLELCKADNPVVTFRSNVTTEGQKQFLDMDVTFPFDLGDNCGIIVFIQHALDEKTFVPLFTISEKNACKAIHKYFGEFQYEVERVIGLPTGVCPVRAGRYRLHHFELHYEKITLQTFPFGKLRVMVKLVDNRLKKSTWCLFCELENKVN